MSELLSTLLEKFPHLDFKTEHVLAPYTTVKIGGPAEVFWQAKSQADFISVVTFMKKNNLPLTVIGWGANILIADRGIRGLVIRNVAGEIKIKGEESLDAIQPSQADEIQARWEADASKGSFKYDFADLDYSEEGRLRVLVEIDAGISLNQAIIQLISKGITGLQWFARVPSTVGGAVYNNIHGGTHFISEVLESVKVIDENGEMKVLERDEIAAGYDESRFHHTDEIIISATFKLFRGDADRAKQVAIEWSARKAIQPSKSLGCVFKNISQEEKEMLGFPTTSVGYIVEHVLGMKGDRLGDAQIAPEHCAFIVNKGSATATDYLELMRQVITAIKEKTGVRVYPEIFFLGFEKEELKGVVYD